MKYFILRQHSFFTDVFVLKDWQDKINPKWICFQDFYKTPQRCVLTVDLRKNVPFPDIITSPFLLFSNTLIEAAEMYGEPFYSRDVIIINTQNQESKHFHLILLEDTEGGHVQWRDSNLFCMSLKGKKEIVVSLDFAESILRRGAIGITLEEIDMVSKEWDYGK